MAEKVSSPESKNASGVPIRHIAFIMDGNGRWAKHRLLPRSAGHKKGVQIIQSIVDSCFDDFSIPVVSLFTFSTENWNRPQKEIDILFSLLKEFFRLKVSYFKGRGTKIQVLGELDDPRIPKDIKETIDMAMEETKDCSKTVFNVLFNYGSRDEIVLAARKIALDAKNGLLDPEKLTKEDFSRYLFTGKFSDIDLLIRTSGEERISNCLLYQIAYAELVFEPTLWPDYTPAVLAKDIAIYRGRNRRFGEIKE
ncbi:MAG: polyprenyl diphosphate synthase [Bacilli bacterium]|jgi:undecaprenyl diphosphate synthase|nr:polyprenyl diphosphate synthase [Bacilli bacterium]